MSSARIGVTLPQFTSDPHKLVDAALRAEAAGLDSIWVFDHLWPLSGGKERPFFESWSTLAWIAACTSRITVGTLVTRSTLRHPAVLGRMGATVADIAPGRVIIGIGSGDIRSRAENRAFGLPYYAGKDRTEQLESTTRVVKAMLQGETVGHKDRFTTIDGLPGTRWGPAPVWVAGQGEAALRVAGRLGDGWNSWLSTPERFSRDAAVVTEAAAGRPIELSWGGLVALGQTDAEAEAKLGNRDRTEWLAGGPSRVRAGLDRLIDAGVEHLVVTLVDAGRPGSIELLAETMAP